MRVGKEMLKQMSPCRMRSHFRTTTWWLKYPPSPFLALPVGPHCHVSWENVRPLGLTIDQLLRRCLRFAGLHGDT